MLVDVLARRNHLPVTNALACPDCPATRADALAEMLPAPGRACAFRSMALASREPIPLRWFAFGAGLVRRGVLVRQRLDAQGRTSAIDAIGPGGFFPLAPGESTPSRVHALTGYAATDALACLCPQDELAAALEGPRSTTHDLLRLHRQALERVERIADARARTSAASKVASLLLALADTLRGDGPRDLLHAELQQRDLAALVSLRHESVCRVLRDLEEGRLVHNGPDGIRLLDREQLETI